MIVVRLNMTMLSRVGVVSEGLSIGDRWHIYYQCKKSSQALFRNINVTSMCKYFKV